ncbi:hypothetical protein [Henriciella aquimarina]|uniref:hypothetical protein n=1 Tax=Henriciella aquimarina TaxID=545261 RepID=UPI000A047895|nr:hypothetical protein [Henriciella aquimarina]
MPRSRFFLVLVTGLGLAACGQETGPSQADRACAVAVDLAADLLPEEGLSTVTSIKAGMSGQAVSCAVTTEQTSLMVDATVSCEGDEPQSLESCTVIDGVQRMDGTPIYP